jgi:hypothetical protein
MLQTPINKEDKDIITVATDIFSYIQKYEALVHLLLDFDLTHSFRLFLGLSQSRYHYGLCY